MLRVAIVATDTFFSYLLISHLVANQPKNIVCMVIMQPKFVGKGAFGTISTLVRRTGWVNFFYKLLIRTRFLTALALAKTGIIKHAISPRLLAERYGIPIFESEDCNNDETVEYLRSHDIDILLSINVYQRMHEPLLAMSRIAAVNTHFGMLPKYKGVSPYIWAMANGEKEIGLSIHRMVYEFDEGQLLRQQRMSLQKGDSAMGVYHRGCMIARKMITEVVDQLEKEPTFGYDQVGVGSYYSMPTRHTTAALKKNGFCLWKAEDLLFSFKRCHNGDCLP
jgi:folate-dependent phosphoribosylglycinamide formyltransferase PurN